MSLAPETTDTSENPEAVSVGAQLVGALLVPFRWFGRINRKAQEDAEKDWEDWQW